MSNELLIALGSRDQQWTVLDKVAVRNQQNGVVSFELAENFDRFAIWCFKKHDSWNFSQINVVKLYLNDLNVCSRDLQDGQEMEQKKQMYYYQFKRD